jgi:hypothetical protein
MRIPKNASTACPPTKKVRNPIYPVPRLVRMRSLIRRNLGLCGLSLGHWQLTTERGSAWAATILLKHATRVQRRTSSELASICGLLARQFLSWTIYHD